MADEVQDAPAVVAPEAPEAPAWRSQSGTSLPEVHGSILIPHDAPPWRKFFAFAGPGFLVAVGYMDPGNWATDLAGGAQFGYSLLWIIMMSNLMAILLQHLCIKLGVVTGRDLAQACRDHYPRPMAWFLWVLARAGHRRHRSRRGRRVGDRPAAPLRHPADLGLPHHLDRRAGRPLPAEPRLPLPRGDRPHAGGDGRPLLRRRAALLETGAGRRARRLHPVVAAC